MEPDRPDLPPGYGVKPVSEGRTIEWSEVEERLGSEHNYWIATALGGCREFGTTG